MFGNEYQVKYFWLWTINKFVLFSVVQTTTVPPPTTPRPTTTTTEMSTPRTVPLVPCKYMLTLICKCNVLCKLKAADESNVSKGIFFVKNFVTDVYILTWQNYLLFCNNHHLLTNLLILFRDKFIYCFLTNLFIVSWQVY